MLLLSLSSLLQVTSLALLSVLFYQSGLSERLLVRQGQLRVNSTLALSRPPLLAQR